MIKLHRILLAGAVLALASSSAMASPLTAGTLGGGSFGVALDGTTDVLTSTTFDGTFLLGGGTGSLDSFPDNSIATISLNLNDLSSFTFTAGGLTFHSATPPPISSSFIGSTSVTRTIIFNGIVDFNSTTISSTLTFNFNQSGGPGGSTSGNLTLVVPAVPEPSSVALAGIGLAAAGLFGLRKRQAK